MTHHEDINHVLAVDKIHAMMRSETAAYSCNGNYLNQGIGEDWRVKICMWAYGVVDHYEYNREVVSLAMNNLDRFMDYSNSSGLHVSKMSYQLSAIACIFIAIKIEGRNEQGNRPVTIHTLADLSCGAFSTESIQTMEEGILFALNWKVNLPIAVHFIYEFMQLFPAYESHYDDVCRNARTLIYELSRYFADLSVCVARLAMYHKPSVVALASIMNAVELLDNTTLPHAVRKSFLTNIFDATNIKEESRQIHEVCMILKESCPAITIDGDTFCTQDETKEDLDDSSHSETSPACVSGRSFQG